MARATFVKKARKDIPSAGIKAGESYYWWKFKRSGKQFSKTQPKRSQLTQSAFYAALYDLQDEIGDAPADDSLGSFAEDIASRLREIGEECQSSLDNMPEGLQQGPTGELLQERIDAMEAAADEVEGIEFTEPEDDDLDLPEQEEGESDEDYQKRIADAREQAILDYWTEKRDELQNVSIDA